MTTIDESGTFDPLFSYPNSKKSDVVCSPRKTSDASNNYGLDKTETYLKEVIDMMTYDFSRSKPHLGQSKAQVAPKMDELVKNCKGSHLEAVKKAAQNFEKMKQGQLPNPEKSYFHKVIEEVPSESAPSANERATTT